MADVLERYPVLSRGQQRSGEHEVQQAVVQVNRYRVIVESVDGQVGLVSYYVHDEREEEFDRLSDSFHRKMGLPVTTEWGRQAARPPKPVSAKFRLRFRYAGIHQEYYRSHDNNLVLSHTENLIRRRDGITFVSLYSDSYRDYRRGNPLAFGQRQRQ